jgi:hypothetical protein
VDWIYLDMILKNMCLLKEKGSQNITTYFIPILMAMHNSTSLSDE